MILEKFSALNARPFEWCYSSYDVCVFLRIFVYTTGEVSNFEKFYKLNIVFSGLLCSGMGDGMETKYFYKQLLN